MPTAHYGERASTSRPEAKGNSQGHIVPNLDLTRPPHQNVLSTRCTPTKGIPSKFHIPKGVPGTFEADHLQGKHHNFNLKRCHRPNPSFVPYIHTTHTYAVAIIHRPRIKVRARKHDPTKLFNAIFQPLSRPTEEQCPTLGFANTTQCSCLPCDAKQARQSGTEVLARRLQYYRRAVQAVD